MILPGMRTVNNRYVGRAPAAGPSLLLVQFVADDPNPSARNRAPLRPSGLPCRAHRRADACHEFLDKTVEAALSQLDQTVGRYCDMLLISDDMGDGRGVTIGPDL